MDSGAPDYSIVVPAYDEERLLPETLTRLRQAMGGTPLVGEIVVCVPVCEAQARSRGASLHEETARMLIHGCLHLLGHDHGAIPDRRRMRSRERRHLDWYRRGRLCVMEVG